MVGLWLLVPEHLRLGTWDLLCGWTAQPTEAVEPRLALQLVHEAALCCTGVRKQRSLNHTDFALANGLPFTATDQQIHTLLEGHTIAQAQQMQTALGKIRRASGHFTGKLLAIDPHRLLSYTKRRMSQRKANARSVATKTSQTFFCVDADTSQPVCSTLSTSARTVAQATPDLLALAQEILQVDGPAPLVVADAEHFAAEVIDHVHRDTPFDLLVPMPRQKHLLKRLAAIDPAAFTERWAGMATAKMPYELVHTRGGPYCVMVQRLQQGVDQYAFNSFLCTSDRDEVDALTLYYPKRWHIEEFFNRYQKMGWKRAGTQNLHVRYGQMTMALAAQAAVDQLRHRLDADSKDWTADHFARDVLGGLEGDIRVQDDTILVTYNNVGPVEHYRRHFEHLPQRLCEEDIDPHIPWLYNFKLDFRFR